MFENVRHFHSKQGGKEGGREECKLERDERVMDRGNKQNYQDDKTTNRDELQMTNVREINTEREGERNVKRKKTSYWEI